MSDVMTVRLHLSGVRVREVRVDSVDRLVSCISVSLAFRA